MTNGEALDLIRPFTNSAIHRTLLEAERKIIGRAQTKIFWLCHGGQEHDQIDPDIEEVVTLLQNRNKVEKLTRVAVIKIIADTVRDCECDSAPFLSRFKDHFERALNEPYSDRPDVRQSLEEFYSALKVEVHPFGGGILDWQFPPDPDG